MEFKFKNYAITHDGTNYVVNKVSQRTGERVKEENQGKEALYPLKYCTTLKTALKWIRDMLIIDELQDENDIHVAVAKIELLDEEFVDVLTKVVL